MNNSSRRSLCEAQKMMPCESGESFQEAQTQSFSEGFIILSDE